MGSTGHTARRAKPANPDRPITIAGKTYTLRFSLKAFFVLHDHWGVSSLTDIGAKLSNAVEYGARDVVAVLYAGTRSHHPDVSENDLLDILDEVGLDGVQEALATAFAAATPDAPEGKQESDPR